MYKLHKLFLEQLKQVRLNFTAANLAQLVFGELFEVVEGARHFVAGKAFTGEVLEAFWIQSRTIAQSHTRNDVFGAIVTRTANHGNIGDIGVGKQNFFDLRRVDVDTTDDVEFFDMGYLSATAIDLQ